MAEPALDAATGTSVPIDSEAMDSLHILPLAIIPLGTPG